MYVRKRDREVSYRLYRRCKSTVCFYVCYVPMVEFCRRVLHFRFDYVCVCVCVCV